MNSFKFYILIYFFIIQYFGYGQIPDGHFIDADETAKKGYKVKPFIQEKEGIYHYAILDELPFDNSCGSDLTEEEQIRCSETKLRELIYSKLDSLIDFKGNVYVYLSVKENADISDITVNSYPSSEVTNQLIKETLATIPFKPGKFENKIVTSRLWTSLTFPSSSKELFSVSLNKMKADKNPKYIEYEKLIFDASEYIFSNPASVTKAEFISATEIISFWMNKDIGMGIPTFGDFFTSLSNKNNQQFLYVVAMINYGLDQKLNHNRLLQCKPIKGKKYSEQEDVREVQLGGAKILLSYLGDQKNNIPMTSKTKKYYKAYQKGELKQLLFK